ncbi:hypothetical protein [Boseongicola aestuarii]|uniref:Uncharacterized protein n=1 Tax=Boseongicola aestuarii TaxID=1470561 RepID=A0A238IZ87_9RHOB|nr:hypothetical protein [Boseongicola aestuarii]SMX23302.1 hypothetical protein BOA8489_01407 [Boseongicola aestuarii]
MKITRDNPDQLILAYVPWIMSILLSVFILIFVGIGLSMIFDGEIIGLLFAVLGGGIGGLCFVAFVRRVQVIFDRPRQTFTLRRRTVFGFMENTRPLQDVEHAIIEHTTNSDGKRLDRPMVVLHRGAGDLRVPLVTAYSNMSHTADIVETINRWLSDAKLDSDARAP